MIVDVVIPFYANGDRLGPVLDAVHGQRLAEGDRLNLIVVDDGTPDDGKSATRLRALWPGINVVRLPENRGRAQARNQGVAAGSGEYVMLLDSDCVLQGEHVVAEHVGRLEQCDVSLGKVTSEAAGIWRELGNRAAANRRELANAGHLALLTTQHVVLKRSAFQAIGGFSETYREYGFEDRDLLWRLAAAGFHLTYADDLVAAECDEHNLRDYTHKARMAGRHTAPTFRHDYPELYTQTPYCRLDVSLHRWLGPVATLVKPLLPVLVGRGDWAISTSWLPIGLRVMIVRSLFAASFMVGTAEAARNRAP